MTSRMSPSPFSRSLARSLLLALTLVTGCSDVVEPSEPLTLSVGPELSLEIGEDFQLSLRGGFGDASWESSAPSVVSVVPVTGFLQALGAGSAVITARRGDQSASVEVMVTVPPLLDLTPADVALTAEQGGGLTASARLEVRNTGGGTLGAISVTGVDYGAGEPSGWLQSSIDGQGILLRGNPSGLSTGTYTAVLQVSADQARNSPQTAAVTLVVAGVPVITLEPAALGIVVVEGENPGARDVAVTNTGEGTLAGLATAVQYGTGATGWLGTPQVQQAADGGTLRIAPVTAGLPRGTYTAQVTVTSSTPLVEPVVLPITLTVTTGPAIVLDPATVLFEAVRGSAAPAPTSVAISNGGGGTLSGLSTSVSYLSGSGGWLSTSLSATTAPATLQLQANPGSRAPGTYTASVQVISPVAENNPVTLSVTLVIAPPPVLSASPGTLSLEAIVGASTVLERTVNLTNAGGGTIGGLTASAPVYTSGAPGWLSVIGAPGSTAPTQLRLRVSTGGLGSGTYQARITVSSTTPGVSPVTVTVNLTVRHTFTTHIRPIMVSMGCGGCHTSAPDYRNSLSNQAIYQQVMAAVVAGNPDASSFYRRVAPNTGFSHSGGKVSTAQGIIIREWILRGARF